MSASYKRIAQTISVLVALTGVAVTLAWWLEWDTLKSVLPQWVTMKITTALSFVFSGIILYVLAEPKIDADHPGFLAFLVSILGVLLLMGSHLAATVLEIDTGIESLFVAESANTAYTAVPGRPSLGTIMAFISLALIALIQVYRGDWKVPAAKILALLIGLLGGMALMGYITSTPALYYFLESGSNAMAIHTAILFILMSGAVTLLFRFQSHPNP